MLCLAIKSTPSCIFFFNKLFYKTRVLLEWTQALTDESYIASVITTTQQQLQQQSQQHQLLLKLQLQTDMSTNQTKA